MTSVLYSFPRDVTPANFDACLAEILISNNAADLLEDLAEELIPSTEKQIREIPDLIASGSLPLEPFVCTDNKIRETYAKVGMYVVWNQKTKKLKIGFSSHLTRRRCDYKRYFTKVEVALEEVHNTEIQNDRKKGEASDFYFIPLWTITSSL